MQNEGFVANCGRTSADALYWRWPDSGDLWFTSRRLRKTIFSPSEYWWWLAGQVLTRRVDNFLRIDPPIAARAIRILVPLLLV